MKYAVNHPWKFVDYKFAWLCGFMQVFKVLVVEFVNFSALLTNFTIIEIVRNFLALVVIAEFDNYFFRAEKKNRQINLIDIINGKGFFENFLIIQCTTSESARFFEDNYGNHINRFEPQICEEEFVDENEAQD